MSCNLRLETWLFPVLKRSYTNPFLKDPGKVCVVFKPAFKTYVRQGFAGGEQHSLRTLKAFHLQPFARCCVEMHLKIPFKRRKTAVAKFGKVTKFKIE